MWILTSMLEFEKERYGSLNGQDVSIDGVDISLFLNSLDIFAERKFCGACYSNENKCLLSIKRPHLDP